MACSGLRTAQLGAHYIRIVGVVGSIPIRSTTHTKPERFAFGFSLSRPGQKTERLLSAGAPLAVGGMCALIYWSSWQRRMSIIAAWARVAWPWGVRVEPSPVP